MEIIHNGRITGRIILINKTGKQNRNSYFVNSRQKYSAIPVFEITIYAAAAKTTPASDVITEFIRLISELDLHLAPHIYVIRNVFILHFAAIADDATVHIKDIINTQIHIGRISIISSERYSMLFY